MVEIVDKKSCCVCQNGMYGCMCNQHKFCEYHLREICSNPTYNPITLIPGPDSSSCIRLVPMGWECPKCGLVNSPSVNFCPCSKMKLVVNVYRANGVVESAMLKENESVIVNNNEVIGQSTVLVGEKENEG